MHEVIHALRQALELEIALRGAHHPLPPAPAARPAEPAAAPSVAPSAEPTAETPTEEAPPAPATEEDPDRMDLFGNKPDPTQDPTLSPYERIDALVPEDSPLRGMTTLEEVEAYCRENVLIPLDADRTNPVFGTGDPNANLMVIGEAPGADEDRQGEPFVGRAGQLLNKILAAIDFKREDIYITNILKSRPPNNRDPLAEEVEAHVPILYKQIAIIRPVILLAVGKTAGNTLLGRRSSLGALRDKLHDFHGLPLVVTYHPAALLRNDQWKRPTWEDVKLLRTHHDRLLAGD